MQERTLLILNGPGLSDRGTGTSLDRIEESCSALCSELSLGLDFRRTDDHSELLRWIGEDSKDHDAVLINPGAGGDAVDIDKYDAAVTRAAARGAPLVEVRLHNIFRDDPVASRPLHGPPGTLALISGMGVHGYTLAIKSIAERLGN